MPAPTLQDAIDQAGSPIALFWKPDAPPWLPPVIEREYEGWQREQEAWRSGVALSDLSYHMYDTFIEGPDATRLLSEVSANDYRSFAVDRAKQFVPVTARGLLVTDGILLRTGEESYTLSGVPAAQTWVAHHAATGGYDVRTTTDPDMAYRSGDPALFRFQVQGPRALDVVEEVFGGPLPPTRFFHSTSVEWRGRRVRALRHDMAGESGYEFIGDHPDGAALKEALLEAGRAYGIVRVGALAYPTASVESGWVPGPVPAIYTDDDLLDYRRSLGLFTYEGQQALHGSFYSDDIEDFYLSPWELGYGRSISFDHDFIGRDALQGSKERVTRRKVSLVHDRDDVRRVLGEEPGVALTFARHRVESAGVLVGHTEQTAFIAPIGTVVSLSVVEGAAAEPGSVVEVVWGEHPGPGTPADADLGFPRTRAVVEPAPLSATARSTYRQ